jgi:hypothetical protein
MESGVPFPGVDGRGNELVRRRGVEGGIDDRLEFSYGFRERIAGV